MNKVPVTRRAVVQRINRRLKGQYKRLRACHRGSQSWDALGDYYVVDTYRNLVVDTGVNMAKLADKIGALQPFEQLADGAVVRS
jgi:hypothetical protein